MSRADKILKLRNAIFRYRGIFRGTAWSYAPQPHAIRDVEKWLFLLGKNPSDNISFINGFKSVTEFNEWVKAL